jgi:hypothetical protein
MAASAISPRRRPAPRLEALEDRLLLSGAAALSARVQIPGLASGPATIRGTVFEDRNGDGRRLAGDPGVAGRTVFLDANRNGRLDPGEASTRTDANGNFAFTNLAPGNYTVTQLVPPGWTATSYVVASSASSASASDRLIGLDRFRADSRFAGVTGQGESVVVLDTGIDSHNSFFGPDANHDGVADGIVYQHDFTTGNDLASDGSGHGTYVASLIGSRNSAYPGVAPGVNLIALKVLDDQGNGGFGAIDEALQWILANAGRYHIVCVNMSFGDGGNYASEQSLYGIGGDLNALAAHDIIVVSAAGNDYQGGDAQPGLSYPAIDPNVIPVGAVWDANHGGPWVWDDGATDYTTAADRIVSFSQRLPGSGEVFAPGTMLTGAAPNGGTAALSGTSTAAAIVSGVVALAQQLAVGKLGHPLTPHQMRDLLNSTGVPIIDGQHENDNVGHTGALFHRIDVFSLAQAIVGTGSVSSGPGSGSRTLSLPAGAVVSVDLGSFHLGRVGGRVFADANGNGKLDPGEAPLANRLVFADANGNGKLDPGEAFTRTDGQGRYTLTGLSAGAIDLRLVLSPGEQQTATPPHLTVASGLDLTWVNLGVRLTSANHAPTLTGDGQTETIPEGATAPAGLNVFAVLGSTFQDADAHGLRGVAVVGVNSAAGQWQFSIDGGRTWRNLGPVSPSSARLLRDQDKIRFVPAAYYNGTATITYRAWDQTTGAAGAVVELTSSGATGGATAFSAAAAFARVVVTPVNNAPVLTGPGHLSAVTPAGDSVSAILAGTVVDPDAGAKTGLALIGSSGLGRWQYSRDGGRTWTDLGAVSFASARLLTGTDRLRFLPAHGWKGSASLTYRAWDQTTGTPDALINLSSWSLTGGAHAYSKEIASASLPHASAGPGGARLLA